MKNDFLENWNLPEPDHLPDPDQFINRLHDARLEANIRKTRRFSAVQAFAVLLIVGFLSFSGLSNQQVTNQSNALIWSSYQIPDSLVSNYQNDIAYYLIDESDDIYSTAEFLNSIDYEPLTALLEESK